MSEDVVVTRGICMVGEPESASAGFTQESRHNRLISIQRMLHLPGASCQLSVCHMKPEPFSVVFSLTTELPCQCETHLKDSGDNSFAERGAKLQDRLTIYRAFSSLFVCCFFHSYFVYRMMASNNTGRPFSASGGSVVRRSLKNHLHSYYL